MLSKKAKVIITQDKYYRLQYLYLVWKAKHHYTEVGTFRDWLSKLLFDITGWTYVWRGISQDGTITYTSIDKFW